MKRISILSLVLLFAFSFSAFAADDPLPANYSFNQTLTLTKLANASIPSSVQASIPTSSWDYHDGYLKAESTTVDNDYQIGTTAYTEIHDGTATDSYTVSYAGHFGNANTTIYTDGVRSGSFYRVTMYAIGTTPPCLAQSKATIKLDHIDDLDF